MERTSYEQATVGGWVDRADAHEGDIVKAHERDLLLGLASFGRDAEGAAKRYWHLRYLSEQLDYQWVYRTLQAWADEGWWAYGVNARSGELTEAGWRKAEAIATAPPVAKRGKPRGKP